MKAYEEVNRGTSIRWSTANPQLLTVCKVSRKEAGSKQWTVYAQARNIVVVGTPTVFVFPRVEIVYGDGGMSLARVVDVTGTGRATVAGSYVEVRAAFFKEDGGIYQGEAGVTLAADFCATIAEGTDPEVVPNSIWWPRFRASSLGFITSKPTRLAAIRGFQTAGVEKYLMLFDRVGNPVAGDAPLDVIVIPPAPGLFDVQFPRGVPFGSGLAWGVSSTPDVYNADAQVITLRAETFAT